MKTNKVIALLNDEETKMVSMIVNGKKYKMKDNETYPEFYQRLKNEVGYDFLENNDIHTKTVKEYKKVKNIKAASLAIATIMATTGMGYLVSGCSNEEKGQNKTLIESINEENQELVAIYNQLLEYENGEQIVTALQKINNAQETINDIAIQNPDKKGKVSYVLAEELAAVHDVYNSTLDEGTLLESEEKGRCYYFTGQANLINLSQGSRDVQEIDSLINDSTIKDYQVNIQNETQKALDEYNKAPKSFKNLSKEIYNNRNSNPEAQMEMAWGQSGVALALNNGLTGKELKNYQEASKNDGTQANRLFKEAYSETKSFALENGEINLEKQKLINSAFKTMNVANHTFEYDNTGFDPSTTEKGKEMYKAIIGDLAMDNNGNYYDVRKEIKHSRKKINKDEALKKFGKEKVDQAERDADKHTNVDTDGDGKVDTPMNDANQQEQNHADDMLKNYPQGYKDGQIAFTNGGSSTTNRGTAEYQRGYRDGYQHAKNVYEDQKQNDEQLNNNQNTKSTEQESTKSTEPTKEGNTKSVQQTTESEVKKVTDVKTIEVQIDGTTYKSSITRVRA